MFPAIRTYVRGVYVRMAVEAIRSFVLGRSCLSSIFLTLAAHNYLRERRAEHNRAVNLSVITDDAAAAAASYDGRANGRSSENSRCLDSRERYVERDVTLN